MSLNITSEFKLLYLFIKTSRHRVCSHYSSQRNAVKTSVLLSFLSENPPTVPCDSKEKLKCPPGPPMPHDLTFHRLCHLPSPLHPRPPPGASLWPSPNTRQPPSSPGRALPQKPHGSFSLLPPISISHLFGDLPWLPVGNFNQSHQTHMVGFSLKPIILFNILYSSLFYLTHYLSSTNSSPLGHGLYLFCFLLFCNVWNISWHTGLNKYLLGKWH